MCDICGSDLPLQPIEHRRLGAALKAVHAAAAACRLVQERSDADARLKGDRSPVTIADFASQAIVVRTLRAALGPIVLVAEEEPACLSALGADYVDAVVAVVRETWPDATPALVEDAIAAGSATPGDTGFWTLDPIDGTKGFLRNQQYAIALAYIENGRPTLGVLGCPNLPCDLLDDPATTGEGIICFAVEGHGAFEVPARNPAASPRRLRNGPDAAGLLRVCASVERTHGDPSGVASVIQHAGTPSRTICLDSQAKYAVVARGQAEAYLRVPPSPDYREWIWDHAAGRLIATEAGCRVTDLNGQALDFSRGRRLEANRGVLCAAPEWHAALLQAVRAAGVGEAAAERHGAATLGGRLR